jgi:branched-chain amino acid transport system permease protein
METFIQAVLDGLLLGLVYTVAALGLSLSLSVMGIVNVAHSTFIMVGSFFALTLLQEAGIDPLITMALAVPVFFAWGALLDVLLLRRVADSGEELGLLMLFGVLVVIETVSMMIWTTDTRVITTGYSDNAVEIGPFRVGLTRILAGAAALLLIALTAAFFQRTLLGKGIRAMAQNRDVVQVLGMSTRKLSMIGFGIAVATAGAAGVALSINFSFAPQLHIQWLAWAFLVVIVGGLGGVRGALIGGVFVGVLQAVLATYISFQYVYLIVYTILIFALLVRSQGLAGVRERTL